MLRDRLACACVLGASFILSSTPLRAEPLSVPAAAQPYNVPSAPAAASASPSAYGGGLLELLLTGGIADGGSAPQAYYATPSAPQTSDTAAYAASADHATPVSQARAYNALAPSATLAAAAIDPHALRRHIDPMFERQEVDYTGEQKPGTIVIDTANKFLFLIEADHKAIRYGIGVGREGFIWSGVEKISRKAEWPDWTPPADMLKRRPDLPVHMEGGPQNPLGARALYLGNSLYRIHGTNEPNTIGTNVSSGCIRMMNEDVEDLYDRVRIGTKVVVI